MKALKRLGITVGLATALGFVLFPAAKIKMRKTASDGTPLIPGFCTEQRTSNPAAIQIMKTIWSPPEGTSSSTPLILSSGTIVISVSPLNTDAGNASGIGYLYFFSKSGTFLTKVAHGMGAAPADLLMMKSPQGAEETIVAIDDQGAVDFFDPKTYKKLATHLISQSNEYALGATQIGNWAAIASPDSDPNQIFFFDSLGTQKLRIPISGSSFCKPLTYTDENKKSLVVMGDGQGHVDFIDPITKSVETTTLSGAQEISGITLLASGEFAVTDSAGSVYFLGKDHKASSRLPYIRSLPARKDPIVKYSPAVIGPAKELNGGELIMLSQDGYATILNNNGTVKAIFDANGFNNGSIEPEVITAVDGSQKIILPVHGATYMIDSSANLVGYIDLPNQENTSRPVFVTKDTYISGGVEGVHIFSLSGPATASSMTMPVIVPCAP